jgi:hypothetical protein
MSNLYNVTVTNQDGEVLERIEVAQSMLDELLSNLLSFQYDPRMDG